MKPVLIIGMARSGTTLLSHILGSHPDVHIEVEPHALWKSGNFQFLNDEEFLIKGSIVNRIRKKFESSIPSGKILVEKSPINCLRPKLVHAVFPDAKIIYVERDPIRCIHSNYKRSISKDSFKFSIILKKYFYYSGSKDLNGAISKRGLFQQISWKDVPSFLTYVFKMMHLKTFKSSLPFGPKLKDFDLILRNQGLLRYHVEVFRRSTVYKKNYENLYGDNMKTFKMENIMSDAEEIKKILDFSGLSSDSEWINRIRESFDKERVSQSTKSEKQDAEIEKMLLNI